MTTQMLWPKGHTRSLPAPDLSQKIAGHFDTYIRSWNDLGAPLRPNPSAIEAYGQLFYDATDRQSCASVMLLGVTPELVRADWLQQSKITAVDQSAAMIAALWIGDNNNRQAVEGDWFSPPIAPGTQDVVLGDGVLNFFSYPFQHQQFAKSMARVLQDNGHLIVRAFCPPEPHLSPEDVLRKAENRELNNFHEFKLLLLAALQQGNACAGVELASVWRSFHAHFPDVNQCAQATAWPVNTIRTIDLYKNSSTRYFLATPSEIEAALSEYFDLVKQTDHGPATAFPTPLLCFRKR